MSAKLNSTTSHITSDRTILTKRMHDLSIDPDLTFQRLDAINQGAYDNAATIVAQSIPTVDGKQVIELGKDLEVSFPFSEIKQRIDPLALHNLKIEEIGSLTGIDTIKFNSTQLKTLGVLLAPVVAYGFLNGGSASSYVDQTKNQKEYGPLFDILKSPFDSISTLAKGKAKGITPAYVNPDGTPGYDFLALKIRAILIKTLNYHHCKKDPLVTINSLPCAEDMPAWQRGCSPPKSEVSDPTPYTIFQMDSILNHSQIQGALQQYAQSDLIKPLAEKLQIDITKILTASQPLLAAYTSGEKPLGIFQSAYGQEGRLLPMPGGHGHSFYVLRDIYQQLLNAGKKFVYLGNIDNLAYTVDDASIALMALTGKQAGFDFIIKTPVDVKGGVLIKDQSGKLNCGDLGVAVDKEDVAKAEAAGQKILFNAATGLFNLEWLVANLDHIIEKLPMRISTQNKDAGIYKQAEQVTWEVLGMLDNPLIFAVDKYDRFLASKMLIEGLMTSGLELENPDYPPSLKPIATKLHLGLSQKLKHEYGLKLANNCWRPI